MKSAEEIKLGTRCPCGGIILADTDECKVPVCVECCIEISNAYLNKDDNYNEGFKRGQQAERARARKLREAVEYTSKQVVWIEGFKTKCTYGYVVEVCRQALAEYERGK